jgi:regulator of protease activity HflC (stomatin/prohibitin superfamily)
VYYVYIDGVIIGGLFLLAFVFYRCYYIVNEGESVLLTSFGKPVADTKRGVSPGLHFKRPWHKLHRTSLRERLARVSGDASHAALARDGTPLQIDATVRYQVQPNHLERYFFALDTGPKHLLYLYEGILRTAVANFDVDAPSAAGTSFEILRRERRRLVEELNRQYRSELSEQYGISFNALDVSGLYPPRELEDALNAVLQAQAQANSHRDEAEAISEQRIIAADSAVEVAQSKANAIRQEIAILGQFLRELSQRGTLEDYVHHRRSEILSQSKTVFVRSES